MTKAEITERIAQGEDSRTQFMRGPIGIAKLAAELVAFSNASMVFDDRVELISPGSLPNHLTIEMMKSGVSVARNPLIFTFATKEIPYRGLGSGIKRVTEIAKRVEFASDSEANFFTAKIYKATDAPIKSASGPVKYASGPASGPVKPANGPVKSASGPVSEPVNAASGPVKTKSGPVNSQAVRLLEIIRTNPGVNKSELAKFSGIAIRTVKRRIEQTLHGKVEFRGAPKTGGYYLVAESKPQRTKAKKRKQ